MRNGMWYGLRNDIIMRTVIYHNDLKKEMKLKIAPFFSANQFTSSRFFNVAESTTMTIKIQGKTS